MTLTTTFSSQELKSPRLLFDYALRAQVSSTPFDGFRRWGPYDKNQPRKTQLKCAIIYPTWASREAKKLKEAFQNGMFMFKGFHTFSRGISIDHFDEIPLNYIQNQTLANQAEIFRSQAEKIGNEHEFDFVFVVVPYSQRYFFDTPYYGAKLTLSAHGIPCQVVTVEKLQSDQTFKWSLANMALQVYSKLGNVPWVVEAPDYPAEMILGVGRREVRSVRLGAYERYMGFTTAYRNNGAFLSFNGIATADSRDTYVTQLSTAIRQALVSFHESQLKQGGPASDPNRIVFHSFKKISHDEIDAIEDGIRLGPSVPEWMKQLRPPV